MKLEYLKALDENFDKLDEFSIGEKLGLTESETKLIIDELLSEQKIEFISFGICSYKVIK